MDLRDAHCHWHFDSLRPFYPEALELARRGGLCAAVVNGTKQADWQQVADFCKEHLWAMPAYGIHPWQAPSRTESWERELTALLDADPRASIGEIGLDGWIHGHDLADQTRLFLRQLEIAVQRNVPVTIHCVRAWEPLRQCLRKHPVPGAGFLLHAYSGPENLISFFAERGAYFSFSPSFLSEKKAARRDAFRLMPPDRVLIETDAPDLGPPPEHNPHPLTEPGHDGGNAKAVNHPANITVALSGLATALEWTGEECARQTTENWKRLFGDTAI